MKPEFSRQIFNKSFQYQISRKSVKWEPIWSTRTDMMKLTGAFRDFVNARETMAYKMRERWGGGVSREKTNAIQTAKLSTINFGFHSAFLAAWLLSHRQALGWFWSWHSPIRLHSHNYECVILSPYNQMVHKNVHTARYSTHLSGCYTTTYSTEWSETL